MLNSLLKHITRWCGLAVVSRRHVSLRYLDHPPSTSFEDLLFRTFPDMQGLNFIQIGANDGRRADPLRVFIDEYAWTGMMFEPLSTNFADLQRHRGNFPLLRLRQAAIDVSAGRRFVYDLAPTATAHLPDWTRGLGSFSRERLVQVTREHGLPETAILAEEVETITWAQVWQEFGPHPCDLLVLDTEGYDMTLLHTAGLAQHRPRLILFEHACNTLDERMTFYRELLDLGYDIATCGGDTVACLSLK
jgi:FkbM family methyltransferase